MSDDDEGPDDDGPAEGGDPGDDGDPGEGGDPGDDGGPATTGIQAAAARGRATAITAAKTARATAAATGPGGPVLPEVTAPLATLQGRAKRPGDNRLLGPLDPALTRDLAAAAARSPHSRWEVTIVDDHGYAAGHGIARPRRGRPQQPPPPQPPGPALVALPARVNITVTETLLNQLAAQPRSGAPPGDWDLAPRTAGDADGPWALTLPGGRELLLRFDVVPTHDCDHRHQVNTYQPSERLRRLVQVRDHECTFPPCSRPARESDFEHAIPYHKGGRTAPATPAPAAADATRSSKCPAGRSPSRSRDGTYGPPPPAAPTPRNPGGTPHNDSPWRVLETRRTGCCRRPLPMVMAGIANNAGRHQAPTSAGGEQCPSIPTPTHPTAPTQASNGE